MKPIVDQAVEVYDKVQDVNAKGTWLAHRAQITQMLKQEPAPTQFSSSLSLCSLYQS